MRIIWDEPKRLANLLKHHLDFADLTPEFFSEAVVGPGKSGRLLAVGWFDGSEIVVVHVIYGVEAISVISMRPARASERSVLR